MEAVHDTFARRLADGVAEWIAHPALIHTLEIGDGTRDNDMEFVVLDREMFDTGILDVLLRDPEGRAWRVRVTVEAEAWLDTDDLKTVDEVLGR